MNQEYTFTEVVLCPDNKYRNFYSRGPSSPKGFVRWRNKRYWGTITREVGAHSMKFVPNAKYGSAFILPTVTV